MMVSTLELFGCVRNCVGEVEPEEQVSKCERRTDASCSFFVFKWATPAPPLHIVRAAVGFRAFDGSTCSSEFLAVYLLAMSEIEHKNAVDASHGRLNSETVRA